MRAHDVAVLQEVQDAVVVYEQQRPGRGARFLAELEAALQRIREAPLSWPRIAFVRHPSIRKAKVMRFPYAVFFYMLRGEPIVVAVAHGRRRQGYWRKRL